jgi:hypothetical protein
MGTGERRAAQGSSQSVHRSAEAGVMTVEQRDAGRWNGEQDSERRKNVGSDSRKGA